MAAGSEVTKGVEAGGKGADDTGGDTLALGAAALGGVRPKKGIGGRSGVAAEGGPAPSRTRHD